MHFVTLQQFKLRGILYLYRTVFTEQVLLLKRFTFVIGGGHSEGSFQNKSPIALYLLERLKKNIL